MTVETIFMFLEGACNKMHKNLRLKKCPGILGNQHFC